jgi:hypothetical protein
MLSGVASLIILLGTAAMRRWGVLSRFNLQMLSHGCVKHELVPLICKQDSNLLDGVQTLVIQDRAVLSRKISSRQPCVRCAEADTVATSPRSTLMRINGDVIIIELLCSTSALQDEQRSCMIIEMD